METREIWECVDRAVFNKGTTLSNIAKKTGISYRTIVNWRAKEVVPRVDEAKSMANAMGMSIEALFFGETIKESALKESAFRILERIQDDDPLLFHMIYSRYGTGDTHKV